MRRWLTRGYIRINSAFEAAMKTVPYEVGFQVLL